MGLAWQQGRFAPGAFGRFLLPDPLPERLLYAEPLRCRTRVRFGAAGIAHSEDLVLLHEPAFGRSGCAGRVALEFGDRREAAVIRMRWARIVDPAPETFPGANTGWWPAIRPRMTAEHTSSFAGGAVT